MRVTAPIEPVPVQDMFFTHIVRADVMGEVVRFVLAVEENGEMVIVGKAVTLLANLPPMTAHCLQLTSDYEAGKAGSSGGPAVTPLHH